MNHLTLREVHTRIPMSGRTYQEMRQTWWNRPFAWLRSWLWHRWSQEQFVTKTDYVPHRVSYDHICALLIKEKTTLRYLLGQKCKHIIIGPKQAYQLADDFLGLATSFSMPVTLLIDGETKIFDMTVHIIPWFDGVLLLPDLKDGKRSSAE